MNYPRCIALACACAIAALAGPAFAQEATVNVDISGLSKDFAGDLGVGVGRVPDTVAVSAAVAADVCGVDIGSLTDGSSCTAISTSDELSAIVDDEVSAEDNSARAFAPGQQEGAARDSAPGQQEGAAKDSAPGQMKKGD
jgi:hypothetical protein